ncbi:hypothetical protein V8C42DRAFT_342309 [Trichoderma barbatum]
MTASTKAPAFTHIVPGRDESINPNTGSLNLSRPIIQLRGQAASIDFKLVLSYNAGSAGAFGLPRNWSLNLPYVIPETSITFSGRTYAIDSQWIDSSGHQSGLRYLNNHGIEFVSIVPPQPLPTGQPGEYAYTLKLQDGSMDYFDALGRPLAHVDIFGNSLQYVYLDNQAGGVVTSEPCLDYIIDSWGQKVQFEYQPGIQMFITGPSNAQTEIRFTSTGVNLVRDPLGFETRFTYTTTSTIPSVLEEVLYPTGLTSKFTYFAMEYLDGDNNVRYLPAVSDHYQEDALGETLQHTNYHFGPSSGLTFTGISIGCQLSGLKDDLMDGGNTHYTYDVLVTRRDKTGKTISATLNWFNYLHLLLSESKYLVDDQGGLLNTYKTEYRYTIDPNKHSRTTNYAQPTEVECFHNISDGGNESWHSLKRSTMSYNAFGELTSQKEEIFSNGHYTMMKTIAKEYYTVKDIQIQRLRSEIETDLISGTSHEIQNALSPDEKTVKTSTVYFTMSSGDAKKPWKTHTKQYDSNGRVTEDKSAWAEGANVPDGSASSFVSSSQYSFRDGLLTVITSDSAVGPTSTVYDMRIGGGPVIRKTLPRGQSEQFEYDALGRLLKHTDAVGRSTTISYTIGPSLISETTRHSNGYVMQTTFDALGRSIEKTDNGDPTQKLPEKPSRMLKRDSYDSLGHIICTKNIIGLATLHTFDALGRKLQEIDPAGNVLSTIYDDKKLTVTQTLNGDIRRRMDLDSYGRAVRQTVFADSGSNSPYCLVQETVFNGKDQKVKVTVSQQLVGDSAEVKFLKSQVYTYDTDGAKASETITGMGDTSEDVVIRKFVYDLLGNKHTWTKETKYGDGRIFSHHGPVILYDMHGSITLLRNQLGQEERNEYDSNGWLTKTTRFDGSTLTFEHDARGETVRTTSAAGLTEIKYNSGGQVESTRFKDAVMKYDYHLDGSARSVDYGGGRIQKYERDQNSRIVSEIDVFGTRIDISYDSLGRKARVASQGDAMEFNYGTANHRMGMLIGHSMSGKLQYTTQIAYDGFQQRSNVRTVAPDSTVLLETAYKTNSRGTMSSIKSTSARRPELNKSHTWAYDGLGQLVEENMNGGQRNDVSQKFTYDGNHNITFVTVNGKTSSMAYNAIDQRTDAGFKYDGNGRLLCDDAGRRYIFDAADHLLGVEMGRGSGSQFVYHGDASLASIARPEGKTGLFYTRDQNINAISHESGNRGIEESSILRCDESIVAAYSPSGETSPTYFFEQQGSTAMQLTGEESTAITYEPYGVHSSTSPLKPQGSFAFGQELVDSLSGVVYLRSRFYQPDNRAFISMDSYHLENRYAYCQGDPINFFDPTGHVSWWKVVGTIAGGVAALAASIMTVGSSLGAGIAAQLVTQGVSETTAAVVADLGAGVVSSVAGNVAGSLVSNAVNAAAGEGWDYSLGNLGVDILAGVAGAAAVVGVATYGSRRAATSVMGMVADFTAQRSVAAVFGQPFVEDQAVMAAMTTLVLGVAISRLGGHLYNQRLYQQYLKEAGGNPNIARQLMDITTKGTRDSLKPTQNAKAAWSEITEVCKEKFNRCFRRDFDPNGGNDGNNGVEMSLLA